MTLTAEDLTTAIETRAERIRELTETEQALEKSLSSGRNAIAAAVARSGGEVADSVRDRAHADRERLDETRSALELLNRDQAASEAQLKRAQARESIERADKSASEAARAINAVNDAVLAAAKTLLSLAGEANGKMNVANGDDQVAKSLNGQQTGIMPRTGWWQRPGLEGLLSEISAYARQHS